MKRILPILLIMMFVLLVFTAESPAAAKSKKNKPAGEVKAMPKDQAVYIKLVRNVPLESNISADKIDQAWKRADEFIKKYGTENYVYDISKTINADGSFRIKVKCVARDKGSKKWAEDNAHILSDYILSGEYILNAVHK